MTASALERARALGRHAVEHDGWMVPIPEEHAGRNLSDLSQSHREGWEQTTHFDLMYRDPLISLAIEDSGVLERRVYSVEDYYDSHFIPLLDAFWDEWEEQSGFYEKAQEYVR